MLQLLLFFCANLILIVISQNDHTIIAQPFFQGAYPQVGPGCTNTIYGKFLSCGYPMMINISGPANITGSIGYQPGDPPLPGKSWTVNTEGNHFARLLIPNSLEPTNGIVGNQNNIFGCPDSNGVIFHYDHADDGTPLAGNFLLVINNGQCFDGAFFDAVDAMGIGGVIVAQDLYETEIGEPNDLAGPIFLHANAVTPAMYAEFVDVSNLINYLQTYPYAKLNASIAGPGRASAATRNALIAIGAQLTFLNFTEWGNPLPQPNIYYWDQVDDPSLDPCSDGLYGVWCERGNVVWLMLDTCAVAGTLDDGGFSYLATNGLTSFFLANFFGPQWSFSGPFPSSFCSMDYPIQLVNLQLYGQFFTTFPDCWDKTPIVTIACLACQNLTVFPSSLLNSPVVWLQFNQNSMSGSLPSSFASATNLAYLQLNDNFFTGSVPTFAGLQNLVQIQLNENMFDSVSPSSFDNLPSLETLLLDSNSITSSLPNLNGSQQYITSLTFDTNFFSGGIPLTWTHTMISQLTLFTLNNNLLTNTNIQVLQSMTLTEFDLSYNKISSSPYHDWEAFLASIIGNSVTTFSISNNLLTGAPVGDLFQQVGPGNFESLTSLDVSYNLITGVNNDVFSPAKVQKWNFAGNPISNSLPVGQPQVFQTYFNFSDCPFLQNPYSGSQGQPILPPFLFVNDETLTQTAGTQYQCGSIDSNLPDLTFALDPSFYSYQGCSCVSGYYSTPSVPSCSVIPSTGISSPPILTPLAPLGVNITGIPSQFYQFSDGWYGNSRTLPGVDTLWEIDLSGVFLNVDANSLFSLSAYSSIDGSSSQPIVAITIYIFVDVTLFDASSDRIEIYLGASSSNAFQTISGTDNITPVQLSDLPPVDTDTLSIVSTFGSIGSIVVNLPYSICSVEFQTRKTNGRLFQAAYVGATQCPLQYTLGSDNQCELVVDEYLVSIGLRIAIYAAAAAISAFMVIATGFFFYHRDKAIIRASSKKFTFITLLAMIWMAVSSVLYAIVPSNNENYLCNGRIWCSGVSLMLILAILVAKSFRVSLIFGSKLLLQVKNVTDGHVAAVVLVLVTAEIVALIVMNALSMTWSEEIPTGDQVVWACNTGNGFNIWMGIQIALFACVMLAGAIVAFRTRSVPSAFNESNHILQSLQIMLFMMIILVPIDWALINNSPEAAIVIQGAGQLLLGTLLFLSNFTPKFYYITIGQGNDKSMLFNNSTVTKSSAGWATHTSGSAVNNTSSSRASLTTDDGTQLTEIGPK